MHCFGCWSLRWFRWFAPAAADRNNHNNNDVDMAGRNVNPRAAAPVPSTRDMASMIQPSSEWNRNDLQRQACILDLSHAPFKPCFEAQTAAAASSASSSSSSSSTQQEVTTMGAIWRELPRPLLETVVAKLPGKELVRCTALDKTFAAMLSGGTPMLRRLLPSCTPREATVSGLPLLVTAGMACWFGPVGGGNGGGNGGGSGNVSGGWRSVSAEWRRIQPGATRTAMSIADCSRGLLLLAYRDGGASWNEHAFWVVNPVTKERVRVDVMGLVAAEMAGMYNPAAMDVADVKMHTTFRGEEEDAGRTTAAVDLFVKLRAYYRRVPRTVHHSDAGWVDVFMHLACTDTEPPGVALRSASPGPARWDPDGGTAWCPGSTLHELLRTLLARGDDELPEPVEHEVSSAVVAGRFYSLQLCCRGQARQRGWRDGDAYLAMLECDSRAGGSAWRVTKVARGPGAGDDPEEVTRALGHLRRMHLVEWRGRLAVVDIMLGRVNADPPPECSSSSSRNVDRGRGGIQRISLKQLERVTTEEDPEEVYGWEPAPGFVEYRGSTRDVSAGLGHVLDWYVRGKSCVEDLAVAVGACGVDDIFVAFTFQKFRDPVRMGMSPPEILYYKGAEGVWTVAPPRAPPPSDGAAVDGTGGFAQTSYVLNGHSVFSFEPTFAGLS